MGSLKTGDRVEVSCDEEGFNGAWFRATIVRKVGAKFAVEFRDLMSDVNKSKLRETVEARLIRPEPPVLGGNHFELHEKIDAYDRDGWWAGVIDSVLADNKYVVCFPQIEQKSEYHISQLRLHLDWVDGKWLQPSQGINQLHPIPLQSYHENVQYISSSPERRSTRSKNMSSKADKRRSTRAKTISLKPGRRSTGANKRQGETNVCGLSVEDIKADDAQCSSFQKPVMKKLTKTSAAERKSVNKVPFDNGSDEKEKMDREEGKDLELKPGMETILNMKGVEEEAPGSHSKNENKFPMTIPCLEFVGEVIVGYPDNICKIHTKASLKQIENIAYKSSLMALYLQGVHTWKREMLLTELRQVLHITTEEHANELTHITSSGLYD